MANWYILCTLLRHEKKVAEKLTDLGFEVFLPSRKVRKKWSDRMKIVEELVMTRVVFVHCEESERKQTFVDSGSFYMMDRANNKVAIVPDKQIEDFRAIISQSAFSFEFIERQLKPGLKVTINNTVFNNVEAEVVSIEGKERVFVRVNMLGCAVIDVQKADLSAANS